MAGRIPQDFINDLLERADIVALIETRVPLKKAGKDYKGLCPFHSEKTPSFHVVPKDQFYHCFGCGQSGSALKFLMDYERLDFVEAVETLADFVGVPVPREEGSRPKPRYTSAYEVLEAAAARYERELRTAPDAIDYLKGRGLTGQIAKRYRIGFAPDAWDTMLVERRGDTEALKEAGVITTNERGRTYDRFRNRIMFPIRDARGRVIGFGGRVMGSEQGPK
ncbi:MAG: CHC2 zinc finger domain-containing protein, partial [Pseudomonadota bacterium]